MQVVKEKKEPPVRAIRELSFFVSVAVFAAILLQFPVTLSGQSLSGRVTDPDGNPLPGASVSITGTYVGVHTKSDGTYLINGLPEGFHQVRFSFTGYEALQISFRLRRDTIINAALESMSVMTGDVVVSATRAGDETPLAYTNVTGELLEKLNSGQDLPYLLSLTPSFIETSEAGNGIGYTSLRIRGTDASRINVTIDGIPLNDPESQQVFWVDLPDLASSVDNIQVQRGAGTSSNGAGAFGASVNIQTKGIEKEPFAEINSLAGSFGTFRNSISAGTGLLNNRLAFQMRFSDIRSRGYIERTGSDHQSAFISGLYRSGKSLLKANLILGREKTGIGWWGVPEEMLKTDRRYNPSGEYTDDNGIVKYYGNESDNYTQNHFQLSYSRKLKSSLSFHSAFHYTRGKGYYEEFKEDEPYGDYGLPSLELPGLEMSTSDLVRRKWMSNDFYGLIYNLSYRNDRISTDFGGGTNLYSGDHFGRIIWMRFPGKTDKDHEWYFNNGTKFESSFYGKMTYSLSDEFSVFGDLQYRYINYNLTGNDDDLRDIGQIHSYHFLNPKAGVFMTLSSRQEAWLSFSVANREPTRTDFKEASGDVEATPMPERLYDTELGYKLTNPRNSLSVNLYAMIYRDQLVPTGELSNVGYPVMTNVKNSHRLGAEVTAGFIASDFLSFDMSVTVSSNKIKDFTEYYTDYNTSDWSAEYKSRKLGRVDIAYSPSLTATGKMNIKVLPSLGFDLVGKYVGRQYFDNTMNCDRMLDPYFVSNIIAGISPGIKSLKDMSVQLLVNNIFNARYESNAYGGNWFEDGVEKTWAYYFPQAGTNFMLKLGLKF